MAKLGEMLVTEGVLTKDQVDKALTQQRKDGGFLGTILLKMKFVSEERLTEFLARQTGAKAVNLDEVKFDLELAAIVTEALAKQYQCVPVKMNGNVLHVAIVDPLDDRAIEALSFRTNKTVKPLIAGPAAIERAWEALYGRAKEPKSAQKLLGVDKFINAAIDDVKVLEQKKDDAAAFALEMAADAPPIIKLVNGILIKAIEMRASDIHVEPGETDVRVRLRIDGVMTTVFTLPHAVKGSVAARLKIMTGLDVTERRFPQDGRAKVQIKDGGSPVDLRVSILPSLYGEKVVIRLLGISGVAETVAGIGFGPAALEHIMHALANPYGLILVTGPTGSGKSTTLYSFLKHLNKEDVNIVTAEDPVEFNLAGISQVTVRPSIGYTFDLALRAFLRQDPDIIMVGEMRDFETAAIAVKASLTGHLVLSTLHTNDAASTVVRLIDMGIEPYLVASATKVVIAQRLVRTICKSCKEEVKIADTERASLDQSDLEVIAKTFRGRGCPDCNNTGYRGRHPVFEVMPVKSRDMKRIITEAGTEIQVAQVARREDMRTLKDEVLRLVNEGTTTVEEALGILMAD